MVCQNEEVFINLGEFDQLDRITYAWDSIEALYKHRK